MESLDAVLPPSLGVYPGLILTGRYVLADDAGPHAGNGLKAFPLPGGVVAVAVADTGRQAAPAAVATARLLAVLRGHLESGASLIEAMDAVDRYAERASFATGATMAVALVGPDGVTQVCTAGHPAPLRVDRAGRAEPLRLSPSRPLGLGGRAATAEVQLGSSESLILFTDGLLTARDGAVRSGAQRLCEAITAVPPSAAHAFGDTLADSVLAAMQRPRGYVDDVALLIVQRTEAATPFHAVLGPDDLSGQEAVALVGAWLDQIGVGLLDHVALTSAIAELASDVVAGAHGGPDDGMPGRATPSRSVSRLTLEAALSDDGVVRICLETPTRWHPRTAEARRGLVVAGGLVDSLTLHHHDASTVVEVRQTAGRPVPLLASGAADRRTGSAIAPASGARSFTVSPGPGGLRFSGAITAGDEEGFRELVHEATCSGTQATVLDVGSVERLSGPAVRVLFDYLNRSRASRTEFTVVAGADSAADQVLSQADLPHLT